MSRNNLGLELPVEPVLTGIIFGFPEFSLSDLSSWFLFLSFKGGKEVPIIDFEPLFVKQFYVVRGFFQQINLSKVGFQENAF